MNAFLRHRALSLATVAFLLAAAVACGLAFAGTTLLGEPEIAVPLLVVLIGLGVVALLGWAAERQRGEDLVESHAEERARLEAERTLIEADAKTLERELRAQLAEIRTGHHADRATWEEVEDELRARLVGLERALPEAASEYEARLDRLNDELVARRRELAETREGRATERRWADQLRAQLAEEERALGPLAAPAAVPEVVLRTAMGLVGASKGVLFRATEGAAAVVASEGFRSDAAGSGIAHAGCPRGRRHGAPGARARPR